jgi:hypothetical protein
MKLFEIATTLADVIQYMPQLTKPSLMEVGPREILGGLCDMIALLPSGDSLPKSILRDKVTELSVTLPSSLRLTGISNENTDYPTSNGGVPLPCIGVSSNSPVRYRGSGTAAKELVYEITGPLRDEQIAGQAPRQESEKSPAPMDGAIFQHARDNL